MKKLMSKLMVGAVVLSVLAPSASYAATTINTSTQVQSAQQQQAKKQMTQEEREANQAKLMEIIKKYTPDLADQFQTLFDQQEKARTQVDAIRDQVKAGTLTREEAQAQLKELGLEGGLGRGFGGKQLDDATKAKVDAIRDQVKAGTLTQEEAQAQLKELGLKGGLGRGFGGKQLDDATKAKVDAIRDQVKAGTLTQEEAQVQLKELGVEFGLKDRQNPTQQILDAAAQDDEAKVKELINQLLEHLQKKNQNQN